MDRLKILIIVVCVADGNGPSGCMHRLAVDVFSMDESVFASTVMETHCGFGCF